MPARVLILALARVSMLAVLVLPATVTPPSAVARSTQAAIDANDPVPVPADLTALEPQVRAYLQPFIEKARNAPADPDARATLGLVYAANGLWTPARACFAEALRSAPSNRQAHYYLGIATAALGNFDASLAIYRDVAARFPDFAPSQHRLGDALLMAGDSDGAMEAFERTIKLAPTKPPG
ncbi:MAG: tetratricopeptide repeat protein, partial [Planctomycetes bacterium]|nr:tetratricopeptide repeat protein [Planctomycetota bacterium]